jgi:hypothetical protein
VSHDYQAIRWRVYGCCTEESEMQQSKRKHVNELDGNDSDIAGIVHEPYRGATVTLLGRGFVH